MSTAEIEEGCITVSAPGKVLVAGGYLVLERPNVGVVLAATSRFHTSIKWTKEQVDMPQAPEEAVGALARRLRVKVESPQFRSSFWYECAFFPDGRLPTLIPCPGQSSNIFVERTLVFTLGYLFKSGSADGAEGGTLVKMLHGDTHGELALAIKLRADNDFYSQTSQLRERGLPCTAKSLATLPPFLQCPVGHDGKVVVAKTGMGSSAALVSSLVGALLSFFGAVRLPCFDGASECHQQSLDPSNRDVPSGLDLTHNLAQACHCVAQGKIGSGFDVSAAVYGTHVYTRFSPSALAQALSAADKPSATPSAAPSNSTGTMAGEALELRTPLERIASCVEAGGGWDATRGQLRLPSCFRMLMGDVCGGSSTPSMVRKVQAWRADPATAAQADKIWSALGTTNSLIAELLNKVSRSASCGQGVAEGVFEAGMKVLSSMPSSQWASGAAGQDAPDPQTLGLLLELRDAFSRSRRLLREMGEEAGVPIEPPVQTRLVDATSALPGVLCAGVPGAGGVDAVFAIVTHPDAGSGVEDLWASWRIERQGAIGEGGEDPGAANVLVCPLLVSASAGGLQSGARCTRELPW